MQSLLGVGTMANLNLPALVADIQQNKADNVTAMVGRINSALEKRARFELAKKPHGSHVLLRQTAAQFADSRTVAAFLVALNADPELMFNRTRKAGTRANLKGFKKVRQLIDYTTGRTKAFEIVSKALFASTIIAAKMGIEWIASAEQELILSDHRVASLPEDIRNAIYEYRHKHMTLEGDSRNQSCQFRTTFNNLGLYDFSREEFDNCDYSLGIRVNLENPLIEYLSDEWELNRFKESK
jgi:hypothetical protein